ASEPPPATAAPSQAATASVGSANPNNAAEEEMTSSYPPWRIYARRSHILPSDGPRYSAMRSELELPALPDMVFDRNCLRLEHIESGCSLEFNALDALRRVDAHSSSLKLAVSEQWLSTRLEYAQESAKPYDWTFASDYSGTLLGSGWKEEPAAAGDAINLERLRRRDRILFYCETQLYEDELGDSGTAQMCWDTRLYWESGWTHLLREVKRFESGWDRLAKLPAAVLTDASALQEHLTLIDSRLDRLVFGSTN
uniref:TIP41-like protein n=1 Tax=Macrostomum lignano TaxID=282301 RepID=A0A1I8GVZ0_9PLAT